MLTWSGQHPDDWRRTWQLIEEKWDKDDPCPDGALEPFNIDARLNGAYIALGLIYGRGDFARTLEVATRAGQDSDCNPSSAAGMLGVDSGLQSDSGANGNPELPALADKKFAYTDYSFNDIVASTIARATKVITAAGGQVTDQVVQVPVQAAVPPPLEQWDPGVPSKRVLSTDTAWQWKGAWGRPAARKDNHDSGPTVSTAGAEATLSFTGTGVIVIGRMAQDGGRADVFLDGAPAGQLEAVHSTEYTRQRCLARLRTDGRSTHGPDRDPRRPCRRVERHRCADRRRGHIRESVSLTLSSIVVRSS